jgi:SPP1 family phage portal protein
MNITDSFNIITGSDFKKIEELFTSNRPSFEVAQEDAINQFKVASHDIFDETVRKKKKVIKGSGETDASGKETTTTEYVDPARIGLSFQQLIVDRRVGFMLNIPVAIDPIYETESDKEKALVRLIDRILNDNKMDYKNKEIARRWMSEMECAEVWYFAETGKAKPRFTVKCNIWSPDLGDTLYPLFDATGDMIAFARKYKLKEGDKDIEHFDIYTAELIYKWVMRDNEWNLDDKAQSVTINGTTNVNPVPNAMKKIPIIYYSQIKPEWADQASAISRLEDLISNHADMNDYFGSPILSVMGEILGFAAKGEQGKILQLAENAKANYLALNSPPESYKMEMENLKNTIYSLSQTPDISFESMRGMGTIAQFTMKAFFMDAHMAVAKKEEKFGIGLQRRFNLLKAAIANLIDTSLSKEAETVQLKPVITPYLPQNNTETIDNLTVAKTGGIMSTETAVEQNPLIEDKEAEMDRLKNDKTSEVAGLE